MQVGSYEYAKGDGDFVIFHLKVNDETDKLLQSNPRGITFHAAEDDMHTLRVGKTEIALQQKQEKEATILRVEGARVREIGVCNMKLQHIADSSKMKQRVKERFQDEKDVREQVLAEAGAKNVRKRISSAPPSVVSSHNGAISGHSHSQQHVSSGAAKLRRVDTAVDPAKMESLRESIVHYLALGPLSLDELRRKCHGAGVTTDDIAREAQQVAASSLGKLVLTAEAWRTVRRDWAGYSPEQQCVVDDLLRRREFVPLKLTPWEAEQVDTLQLKDFAQKKVEDPRCDADAENLRQDFERRYNLYKRLDGKLGENHELFERLAADLEAAAPGDKEKIRTRIATVFRQVRPHIKKYYKAYLKLHNQLELIKAAVKRYEQQNS